MTILQMLQMIGVYSVAFVIIIYVARATARRVAGALAGGAVVGLMALGSIGLGETLGWWKISASTLYLVFILYVGLAITGSPFYIVTWRGSLPVRV